MEIVLRASLAMLSLVQQCYAILPRISYAVARHRIFVSLNAQLHVPQAVLVVDFPPLSLAPFFLPTLREWPIPHIINPPNRSPTRPHTREVLDPPHPRPPHLEPPPGEVHLDHRPLPILPARQHTLQRSSLIVSQLSKPDPSA